MKLQLKATRVEKLELLISNEEVTDSFDLAYSAGFSAEMPCTFIIKFDISIASENGYSIVLIYVAEFHTDAEITEDFKNSHYPKVNAPAIVFPYLRSYISFITLNSGYQPLMLPTLNFQAMADKYTKNQS